VIRTCNEGGEFRLSCTDSGIGIAPEALPRIFSPFEQADAEVSRGYGGLEDAAMALALCLEEYGYVVQHVATCADALRIGQAQTFDAVLTDIGLPDGSGIDVGRVLSRRLPVVALSGYGREQDREQSAAAGFAAHLIKPADPAEVHAKLSEVLASERAA
jgi:CheY-like chemotaxis protein